MEYNNKKERMYEYNMEDIQYSTKKAIRCKEEAS